MPGSTKVLSWRNWGNRLLDGLLPRHCVLCGWPSGCRNLCADCSADLPTARRVCPVCALPVHLAGVQRCGRCQRQPPPWNTAIAALAYCFPADWLVCRFKFGRDFACGQILGREMLAALRRFGPPTPDVIVPVPLHRLRHFSRTFNQADLLARFLGREMGVPVHSQLLSRQRRTRAQSGLQLVERRRNIRGAFRPGRRSDRIVSNQHVALVDDVMTTGATLSECAKILKRAGAASVSVWVAARAPPP